MAGQFDEAFYRNKRAALLSSFLLILSNMFSLRFAENASIYSFKIDAVSHHVIIFVGLLVCLYLNLSYLLHYKTEVPAWRRTPETGLQEVENLRATLSEGIAQSQSEQEQLLAAQKDMGNHLDVLSNSLENFVAKDFPQKLENAVRIALQGRGIKMGELGAIVFNQLSAAIRKDPMIAQLGKDHLKWDVLTDQITERVAEKIIGTFNEQYERMLESCRNEIVRHMSVTREGLESLKSNEMMRLSHLRSALDKNRETEKALRNWLTAMNLRVRAHYLYLPLSLFIIAVGWSLFVLSSPFLHQFKQAWPG
jgi:hypothetical protein